MCVLFRIFIQIMQVRTSIIVHTMMYAKIRHKLGHRFRFPMHAAMFFNIAKHPDVTLCTVSAIMWPVNLYIFDISFIFEDRSDFFWWTGAIEHKLKNDIIITKTYTHFTEIITFKVGVPANRFCNYTDIYFFKGRSLQITITFLLFGFYSSLKVLLVRIIPLFPFILLFL